MIFQVMDDKKECFAVFSKGIFYYDNFPKEMSHTWSYNEKLSQEDITYFYLWGAGQDPRRYMPRASKEKTLAV